MRIPRVPSLLHFARFASRDKAIAKHRLTEMSEHPPRVSYTPSKKGARDHLILGVTPEMVLAAVATIKGKQQRAINLAALTTFFKFSPELEGRRFADIEARYFPIGRKMHVPVNPFLFSVKGSSRSILWPSFWSELKLDSEQLAVCGTMIDQTFLSSVDYSSCVLELVDLGRLPGEPNRSVRVIRRGDIPTMTMSELKEFTDPFAEALIELVEAIRKAAEKTSRPRSEAPADWYLDQPPP